MTSKTQRFHQSIEAEEILIQPGIHDRFIGRLVQQMGFEPAAIAGAGLSETHVGCADVGLGHEEDLHASRPIALCTATHGVRGAIHSLSLSPEAGADLERSEQAASFPDPHEQMSFAAIRDVEQRLLTTAQREAKYGTAR